MSVINERYDQFRIEKIKNYLEDMAGKDQTKHFEIYVDDLKVVPKTGDPKQFEDYERYMDEHTEKIRIVIYASATSPRNDQYCFTIEKKKKDAVANGLGEIETIVQEKLAARDREYEFKRLQEELEKTKSQLAEAEEYADMLKQQLEEAKANRLKIKGAHLGEIASIALESMVRRNPQWLNKLPFGEALAGIIEQENQGKQITEPATETTASFQKKSSNAETKINPDHQRFIPLLEQLEKVFEESELELVMMILEKLAEEPPHLKTIADLLNIPLSSEGGE